MQYESTRPCSRVPRVRTRVRRRGRAALRGISRALARQQGDMLAQVAELIVLLNAREGGNSDYQDLGLEVDDDDPTDSPSSSRTGVRIL